MTKKIVTRFAPSPTGSLHVGGARTALFNYLFARKNGGLFRLRIEDTDRNRSSEEMTRQIFEGLKWLGLAWDGEVVYQGANSQHHRNLAESLVEKNLAYRCFCSREKLEAHRKQGDPRDPKTYLYPGTCRHLSPQEVADKLAAGMPHAVRFRTPAGQTIWEDGVHGTIRVENAELDDFIILRSDGSPIYQLAVVADDHGMAVTDVIRGDDHISNTPKQILLYRAFGWEVPNFSHVPLILGPDKKRLSKRHGATAVEEYRSRGILPEAMFNYLALLGWSPGDDRELLSRDEIEQAFSLDGISKNSAVFDEKKLEWMNGIYLSSRPAAELFDAVSQLWEKMGFISGAEKQLNAEKLRAIIELQKTRAKMLSDFALCGFYFRDPEQYDETGIKKHLKHPDVWQWLRECSRRFSVQADFGSEQLEKTVRSLAEQFGISAGKLIHPLRLALTGLTASPGLFEVMELLGKDTVLRRIESFISRQAKIVKLEQE